MEVHKLHYMLSFLARTPARVKHPDEYGKAILLFDKHIRACYAEPIDKYSGNDLAKMLLVDGYFILRLFLMFFMADLREDLQIILILVTMFHWRNNTSHDQENDSVQHESKINELKAAIGPLSGR
ncbi:hypothetical protein OIU85_004059 [Salix viminalis]|uniref:Uncharacterized protein n=1 Tax=Salix viminalis TaxID=40686 RepID=A0A9Q0SXT3_SALVM|nr:hypothetical protein OIU85_004059 [Salix viminalis]